jgi:outer membrane biosynthesis protein TonB
LPPPRLGSEQQEERPFWVFLLIAAAVFAAGVMLGSYLHFHPPAARTDLEFIEGIENQPPPIGAPDAGGPAPEQPPPPQPPEPEPESPPLAPEPVPMPQPVPDFAKPEDKPPATPAPVPQSKQVLKPPVSTTPPKVTKPNTSAGGTGTGESTNPNAKPGPRGVPAGVPNGQGGQKGGFISRPDMPIDRTIITQKYYGRGMARVTCAAGAIVSVEINPSINTYCDSRAKQWIQSHWRCAPGTNGTFAVPIIVKPN